MKTLVKKFLFVGIIVCCLFACSKVEDESKINDEALVGVQSVNLNTAASARGGYPGLETAESGIVLWFPYLAGSSSSAMKLLQMQILLIRLS